VAAIIAQTSTLAYLSVAFVMKKKSFNWLTPDHADHQASLCPELSKLISHALSFLHPVVNGVRRSLFSTGTIS
jgi:hypothetical protein